MSCVREATSNAVLEADDLTELNLPQARTLPCRIEAIEDLAPGVRQFVLRLPPEAGFDFRPGQYIDVIGARGLRRSYSLARVDTARGYLTLHVRRVPEGMMSGYWFGAAKPNDLMRLHGPLGTFVLRDVAGVELVFLVTGTGIAPVWAMLVKLSELGLQERPRSTHVIWGGRVPTDLYADPRVVHPQLHYTPTLSRAAPSWQGARDYVQDVMLASGFDLGNARVYACGSAKMIHAAREKLLAAGLAATSFHSDAFVPSEKTPDK